MIRAGGGRGGNVRSRRHVCMTQAEYLEDLRTWQCKTLAPRVAKGRIETALRKHDLVLIPGGNFSAKTFNCTWIGVEAWAGLQTDWCPVPADIRLVGITKPQARAAFARYLKLFIPPRFRHSGTRREGNVEITEACNASALHVFTQGAGAHAAAGARLAYTYLDEGSRQDFYEESTFRFVEGMTRRVAIGLTPAISEMNWLEDELKLHAEEMSIGVVPLATFENGVPPCQTCGWAPAQWDARLRELGIERRQRDWLLAQRDACLAQTFSHAHGVCGRCWTFGYEPALGADEVRKATRRTMDPDRLAMRWLGEFTTGLGSKVFPKDQMAALRAFCTEPKRREGPCAVWMPPLPGHAYGHGIDEGRGIGARGAETTDAVLDCRTGEFVALWAADTIPWNVFAYDAIDLARRYAPHCVCPEAVPEAVGLIPVLLREGDLVLYEQRDARKLAALHKGPFQAKGWVPTSRAKGALWDQLYEAICRGLVVDPVTGVTRVQLGIPGAVYLRDRETVDQLATWFYNADKGGAIEVPPNKRSDRIVAHALALEAALWLGTVGPRASDGARDPMDGYLDQMARQAALHGHPDLA